MSRRLQRQIAKAQAPKPNNDLAAAKIEYADVRRFMDRAQARLNLLEQFIAQHESVAVHPGQPPVPDPPQAPE